MEKFELKLLLDRYVNIKFDVVCKEAVKLSKLGLTMEQIENLFNIIFGIVKNMLPNSQSKNIYRSSFDDVERGNNLDEKLCCIIDFFGYGYYLCCIFPEICDQTKIRLLIDEFRSDCIEQGMRLPSREEVVRRYEVKIQQEGTDEQSDLSEPQEELKSLQKDLAILRALGFE
jgi:hypothetical protein